MFFGGRGVRHFRLHLCFLVLSEQLSWVLQWIEYSLGSLLTPLSQRDRIFYNAQ